MRGASQGPGPENCYCGSVEAEQVPVARNGEDTSAGPLGNDDWSGKSHTSIVGKRGRLGSVCRREVELIGGWMWDPDLPTTGRSGAPR